MKQNNGTREYVKKDNLNQVREILQADYDNQICDVLEKESLLIRQFLNQYNPDMVKMTYENLSEARKEMIHPIVCPDEEFIQMWLKNHEGQKNDYPEKTSYLTARGETVRSKSEKILADLFHKYQIPYSYESKLCLSNGAVIYPDFVLLNIRTRKTIVWEHFGMVQNPDYAQRTFHKLDMYEKNGFELGKNLIFTLESNDILLDVAAIEVKIKRYLL
ncbi:hypothetical protein [Agathobacter ruminis]|uniref:hypothetical protein n=1 Tax=Agathobacter ruminis TaxID=1712665 RepID=UPI001671298B|nr:hypothetical protein [Agathobacter ruminis]